MRLQTLQWRNRGLKSLPLQGVRASARELGISKGEVYAIMYERLGKRVSSLKQLGEQNLKKLYNIMMAMER